MDVPASVVVLVVAITRKQSKSKLSKTSDHNTRSRVVFNYTFEDALFVHDALRVRLVLSIHEDVLLASIPFFPSHKSERMMPVQSHQYLLFMPKLQAIRVASQVSSEI
jgi:hypothetical protein